MESEAGKTNINSDQPNFSQDIRDFLDVNYSLV